MKQKFDRLALQDGIEPGCRLITLARLHRAGELTAVWVPDTVHKAIRDLVRARVANASSCPHSCCAAAGSTARAVIGHWRIGALARRAGVRTDTGGLDGLASTLAGVSLLPMAALAVAVRPYTALRPVERGECCADRAFQK